MKAFRILGKRDKMLVYQKVRGHVFADGLGAHKTERGWRITDIETGIAVDNGPQPKMREALEAVRKRIEELEAEKERGIRGLSYSDAMREIRRQFGTIKENLGVNPTEFPDGREIWRIEEKRS